MNKNIRHNWVLDNDYEAPNVRRYFCNNCHTSFNIMMNNMTSLKTKIKKAIEFHGISQDCRVQKIKKIMDE